ncbi:hypothetical protein E8K88_11955 [Lampropedia aestuarii]|uniref:Uncharacterized protein n=1 Tax=Lampropedia aestuarii TaxID=2562762 RepID=A0A4S5BJ05_9BURK|nr:DUF6682 family protein [Lampropedia aestuarii]THJ32407.1 hypothetical protein E8K88_11955 [Lampropedia aestuarii]
MELIQSAATELQDASHIRWSVAELAGFINDGQRYALSKMPAATSDERVLALAAGVAQTVPADCFGLLDLVRNDGTSKRAIRQVSRDDLDGSAPGWASGSQRNAVIHFIQDPRTPKRFDVYPPVAANVPVLAIVARTPESVAEDGTGEIAMREEYTEALRHYLLFRAWSKDAEYGGNNAMASAHWGAFTEALGIVPARSSTGADPTQ